jgi:hypothetical protein
MIHSNREADEVGIHKLWFPCMVKINLQSSPKRLLHTFLPVLWSQAIFIWVFHWSISRQSCSVDSTHRISPPWHFNACYQLASYCQLSFDSIIHSLLAVIHIVLCHEAVWVSNYYVSHTHQSSLHSPMVSLNLYSSTPIPSSLLPPLSPFICYPRNQHTLLLLSTKLLEILLKPPTPNLKLAQIRQTLKARLRGRKTEYLLGGRSRAFLPWTYGK